MEPIEHPPGHEIERLNREIEEQYSDVESTPASGATVALITALLVAFLSYVAFGAEILVPVVIVAIVAWGLWFSFRRGTR